VQTNVTPRKPKRSLSTTRCKIELLLRRGGGGVCGPSLLLLLVPCKHRSRCTVGATQRTDPLRAEGCVTCNGRGGEREEQRETAHASTGVKNAVQHVAARAVGNVVDGRADSLRRASTNDLPINVEGVELHQ
jgi:hypothetical protein